MFPIMSWLLVIFITSVFKFETCLLQETTDDEEGNSMTRENKMQGHIEGGRYASIGNFPSTALLIISCSPRISKDAETIDTEISTYYCGGTIINQGFVLTAGHCLDSCHPYLSYIDVGVGVDETRGISNLAAGFEVHWDYTWKPVPENDIAIVQVKNQMLFGETVKRIIIMRNPPPSSSGILAGWGNMQSSKPSKPTKRLRELKQIMPARTECLEMFPRMPKSAFCTKADSEHNGRIVLIDYGDSGSGVLISDGEVLAGVVSYKIKDGNKDWTVHTNVSFHVDWISKVMRKIKCRPHNKFY